MDKNWTVISLGGSIIVPDGGIDTNFLAEFAALIRKHIAEGERFIIVTGGGRTARQYQDAARTLGNLDSTDLDWLGIHSSRLNGHLMHAVLCGDAYNKVIVDPEAEIPESNVIVAAGWKPGWSTDYVAVKLAKNAGAKKLVNLSNIAYVYTADPKKNPDAQKIEKTNWADFRKLLPENWTPGLSTPFDPMAAKEAMEAGMEVAVIKGTSLADLDNYLSGKSFQGTLIKD